MEAWIWFTLLAATMQAVRTAAQKNLARHLRPMTATLVRYLFGLPFVLIYLMLVGPADSASAVSQLSKNWTFIVYATLGSVAQIVATFWLIKALGYRNFAVGTSFAKTEALQTAVFGAVFFAASLSPFGWIAVMLGVAGTLVVSLPQRGKPTELPCAVYGILAGTGFAVTSLWLRQASLSLPYDFIENAALTLAAMVSLQTLICLAYTLLQQPQELLLLRRRLPAAVFIGATSALGSVGWYTAMTFQNPALVKSLGQIEFLLTLAISVFIFRERINPRELLGMLTIIASVIIVLLLA